MAKPDRDSLLACALQEARLRRELSVADVAADVGCSDQQWRNYESGKALPKMASLQRIADALQIDLLALFSKWSAQSLHGQDEAGRLREILTRWLPDETGTPWPSLGIPGKGENNGGHRFVPHEDATAQLVREITDSVVKYRENLFARAKNRRVTKVVSINDDLRYVDFPGKKLTQQCLVGASQGGLGYVSTIVSIEPDHGAFHQHLTGPFPKASIEFFSVLKGRAALFLEQQHPADWAVHHVAPGSVGQYAGCLGHAYLNVDTEPLLLFIVTVPYPPVVSPPSGRDPVEVGYAAGVEFTRDGYHTAMIPEGLKAAIGTCDSGAST